MRCVDLQHKDSNTSGKQIARGVHLAGSVRLEQREVSDVVFDEG